MVSTLMERPKLIPVQSVQAKPKWTLDPSLLLYLPLWNISGDVFLSQDVIGHTVTRVGATATGQGGMSFDGTDDYVKLTTTALKTTERTIAIWFRTSDTDAVLAHYENGSAYYGWNLVTDSTPRVYFTLRDNVGASLQGVATIKNPTDNLWHQVVITDDGVKLRSYTDGLFENSADSATPQWATTMYVYLGVARPDNSPFSWLSGFIGEIAVLDKVLTAHEVWNNFNLTRGRYGG